MTVSKMCKRSLVKRICKAQWKSIPVGKSTHYHRADIGTAASRAASCAVWTLHTVVLQSYTCHMNTCTGSCRHEPACGVLGYSSGWMQYHTAHTCMDDHLQPPNILKPGFQFPLPELTARVNGPSWRVTGFHYPSTRAMLTGVHFH